MDSKVKQDAKSKKEIRADIIAIIDEALRAKGFHLTKARGGEDVPLWDIFDDENGNYHGVVVL